jgi:hypothetical protein
VSGYAYPLFTSTAPDPSPRPTDTDAPHQQLSSIAHGLPMRARQTIEISTALVDEGGWMIMVEISPGRSLS